MPFKKLGFCTITAYIFAAAFLLMVLVKGLLAALFAGLLVYSLIHLMTPMLGKKISSDRARIVVAALLGIIVIGAVTLAIWGSVSFFRSDAGNLQVLLQRLAAIIDASRDKFPAWLKQSLPVDADALREAIVAWLHEHAVEAKIIGAEAGRTAAHILIGMIIGAMVALHDTTPMPSYRPLSSALRDRVVHLDIAFRNIVFAQVWISVINTAITAIFVLIVLPSFGVTLPLSKSLIAITFFAGLLPVVGNLISNSMLVIVALSQSLQTAIAALIFMVVLHKLEYFLNARIIGSKINATAWELLTVMLVMESIFGLPGVIAAPVFYAYMKREMIAGGLV
jgi:predicted PurR-regulated permease PerM